MTGTLYLVATPIGNLEDMSFRAVRVLKEADLIACEDTRTSRTLLKHYEIGTPLTSYHKFNEHEKSGELLGKLFAGQNIALITDAGMPAVSDPGAVLVRVCRDNAVPVTVIPGASASLTALALSGRDTRRFAFEGFLPADPKERRERMSFLKNEIRTMILYEAPHRLGKTLAALAEALGNERPVTLCRELTKKFEESSEMTLGEAAAYYGEGAGDTSGEMTAQARGEFVLVIEGKDPKELKKEEAGRWEELSVAEHVALYEEQGMSRKEAMKAAATDRGLSRRDIYQTLLKEEH